MDRRHSLQNADLITPKLYLGGWMAERNWQGLQSMGVTHILQVGCGLTPSFPGELQYLTIDIEDSEFENIIAILPKCFKFMSKAYAEGGTVLVHCLMGISRSASVVIAWLMESEKIPLSVALPRVKKARSIISPNSGFLQQLSQWDVSGRSMDLAMWDAEERQANLLAQRRAQMEAREQVLKQLLGSKRRDDSRMAPFMLVMAVLIGVAWISIQISESQHQAGLV